MNPGKVEVMVGRDRIIQESCRDIGADEQTHCRWRNKRGGTSASEAKKLQALGKENERLKRIVADLSVDNTVPREAVEENTGPRRKGTRLRICAGEAAGIGARGLQGAGTPEVEPAPHAGHARRRG